MDLARPDAERDAVERLLLAKCTSDVDRIDDRRRARRSLGGSEVGSGARVVNSFSPHALTVAGVQAAGQRPEKPQIAAQIEA